MPPAELQSAASLKAGNTSSRSHAKSSRSRKKCDKKHEQHLGRIKATEPFRTIAATTPTSRAPSKKKLSQRKVSTSSRASSTQNLFKPNPNFSSK